MCEWLTAQACECKAKSMFACWCQLPQYSTCTVNICLPASQHSCERGTYRANAVCKLPGLVLDMLQTSVVFCHLQSLACALNVNFKEIPPAASIWRRWNERSTLCGYLRHRARTQKCVNAHLEGGVDDGGDGDLLCLARDGEGGGARLEVLFRPHLAVLPGQVSPLPIVAGAAVGPDRLHDGLAIHLRPVLQ